MKSISVCMASYNGEKFIEQQIESIICQLRSSDELIVVDDGSSDDTMRILESFRDRITIVRNEQKLGVYKNFEKALLLSQNEYIFLADQDDIWEHNKVEVLCKLLEGADIVCSDCTIVDSAGIPSGMKYSNLRAPRTTFIGNFWRMGHLGCCMAFNRRVLNFCTPFPSDDKFLTHDLWILLGGLCIGTFSWESEPLIRYRRHSSNHSSGGAKTKNNWYIIFLIRIHLLKHLILRRLIGEKR